MTDSRKGGTVEYVASSGTRESIVAALRSEARTARELCAALDASESGVYAATNDLQERNLIETVGGRFRLTGLGLVVADAVERRRQVETLLAADPCYWQTHDVRALPDAFRARLGELADAEVFRASETDPGGAVRLIHEHLLDADAMSVISPVHFPNLGRALHEARADRPGRLLVTDAVVEEIRRHDTGVVPIPENSRFVSPTCRSPWRWSAGRRSSRCLDSTGRTTRAPNSSRTPRPPRRSVRTSSTTSGRTRHPSRT